MVPTRRSLGALLALVLLVASGAVAASCIDELRALPPDQRDAVYLDLGDELGVPSAVSTSWLSGGPFQEPYEDLLQAAYLVTNENDAWYRELHFRLFGTTKYSRVRWTLHLYDWFRSPAGFWTPFRRERGLLVDDALRVAQEDVAESIVEEFRKLVREYPFPAYFVSRREWRACFDGKFAEYVRTANGVPRAEIETFGPRATLSALLLEVLPRYHRHHDYVPYDREEFEAEAQRFAAMAFPETSSVAAALVRALGAARQATLPPMPADFRRHLQASFLTALKVATASLLREHRRRERRADSVVRFVNRVDSGQSRELGERPMAVLPPPSGAAPGLSKYRRRRLAAAETLVEPQGEVPLENVPLELKYTELAERQMDEFDADGSKRGVKRQLEKALLHLAANQKHPGLNSHRFNRSDGTWISYVQNGTGANYRLIWRYVPRQRCIQVERITPHT